VSRIRVLQIVAGLDVGNTFGGAERCGLALARGFNHDEVEPFVCSFWQAGSDEEARQIESLQNAGISFFFATTQDEKRESKDFFAGARRIANWCQSNRVDIAHAHHEGGALAAWIAKRVGGAKRAIRTAHVPLELEWGAGGVGLVSRAMFSYALFPFLMDVEVNVSLDHAEKLRRRWPARFLHRKPVMIHQAVPREGPIIDPATRTSDGNVIISVGRLTEQKSHRVLIAAMPRILAVVPDAKLWIVGDGELRQALQQQINESQLDTVITLWGARGDVPAMLAKATVFALPSVWEGIPVSMIESISAGVPVVASDLPGVRELIAHEQSGWLVPAEQPKVLADALIDALTDASRRLAFACEAQKVLPEFSMPAIVERHMSLYRSILQA
jgi:glycosyltransferase involved in cell wall biosynthesis